MSLWDIVDITIVFVGFTNQLSYVGGPTLYNNQSTGVFAMVKPPFSYGFPLFSYGFPWYNGENSQPGYPFTRR